VIALKVRERIRFPDNVQAVPGDYVVSEGDRVRTFSSREELELRYAAEGRDIRLSRDPKPSRISDRWDVFDIVEYF